MRKKKSSEPVKNCLNFPGVNKGKREKGTLITNLFGLFDSIYLISIRKIADLIQQVSTVNRYN